MSLVAEEKRRTNWQIAFKAAVHLPVGFHTFEQQQHVLLLEKNEVTKSMEQDWGPLSAVVKIVDNLDEKVYWMRLAHTLCHYSVEENDRFGREIRCMEGDEKGHCSICGHLYKFPVAQRGESPQADR